MPDCVIDGERGEFEQSMADSGMDSERVEIDMAEEINQVLEALAFGSKAVMASWFRALVGSCKDSCWSAGDHLQIMANRLFHQGQTEAGASVAGLCYIIQAGLQTRQRRSILPRFVYAKGNMLSYFEHDIIEFGKFITRFPNAAAAIPAWTQTLQHAKTTRDGQADRTMARPTNQQANRKRKNGASDASVYEDHRLAHPLPDPTKLPTVQIDSIWPLRAFF
jgi:hypothetical protein